MSLDVYLYDESQSNAHQGSGIFIREDGQMKELTRAEWNERYPDREPFTVEPDDEYNEGQVYWANITHNLGKMASEAGIYQALWRPAEILDPVITQKIREQESAKNWHDAGGVLELERSLPTAHARDIAELLKTGLALLRSDPDRFKAFNPENGWGDYDGLVGFVDRYLAACERWPAARISISR